MDHFGGFVLRSPSGKASRVFGTVLSISILSIYILCEAHQVRNDACQVYDTCTVKQFFRTCSCESDCYRYRTCCKDAPEFYKMKDNIEQFECYENGTHSPVFAKATCSDGWVGDSSILEGCVNKGTVNSTTDFMSQVLVSSNRTDTTYWNWNCALCNHEDIQDLIFWTVQISCTIDGLQYHLSIHQAKENLVYNDSAEHWGVMADDGQRFVPCSVSYFQPAFLMGRLRLCAPNIISSCPSSKNNETKAKCLAYHGERKHKETGIYYKNAHCAKCNGISFYDLDCHGRNYMTASSVEDSKVLKVIFNLNSWTGEHDEANKVCPKGYRYDPFLHICRDLSLGITNASRQSFSYEMLTSTGAALLSTPVVWSTVIIMFYAFQK